MPLDPQVKVLLDMIKGMPTFSELSPAAARKQSSDMRAMRNGQPPAVANVEDRMIPGPAGSIPVRIYTPSGNGPFPVLVYYHGGGFVIGDLESHDGVCRQLTNGAAENIHPMWSPDSAKILFNTTYFSRATAADGRDVPSDNKVVGEQIDKKMDLATIRPDGTDLKRITTGGGYTYASFSRDGMSILHRRVEGELSQIFVMKADGSDDRNVSGESKLDGWPAWSPDGKRIIFSRRIDDRFQIFVMNRDGSNARQLTDATGEFTNPRWSPDGTKILCARRLGDINLIVFPAPK